MSDGTTVPAPGQADRKGVFRRLYDGETNVDFIGRARLWFLLSGVVILAGLASLVASGLNLGIDFEGGTVWEVPAGDAGVEDAADAVADAGLDDAEVQTLSGGGDTQLRISSEESGTEVQDDVSRVLADLTGNDLEDVSVSSVGPSWGDEITDKAVRALVVFLVVVTLYISLRFEWKMAVATLVALVHDILVTVGVYSLFGFPVTPATVIAFLTILGFSIYDGIVVFDRVDENAKALAANGRTTYSTMVNDSLNQVLMRTLNTSITALLPILSLLTVGSLVLGATTLQEFALALFIGLASGAYSSIFIAAPVLALLKEREARWQSLRRRLDTGRGPLAPGAASRRRAPVEVDGGELEGDEPVRTSAAARPDQRTGAVVAPRPRKRKGGARRR